MTDNEKSQVRFNLAMNFKEKSLDELQSLYEWVVGKQSGILPVSQFEVVKK